MEYKSLDNWQGLLALSPLMVFVLFYLTLSIIAGDFYKVPITVAFATASISSPLQQKKLVALMPL